VNGRSLMFHLFVFHVRGPPLPFTFRACYSSRVIHTEQLLSDLTPEQREAATYVDGPLLIVAGAGSGKTRVITRRVAHLISLGIPPDAILAITFTNKAAGEMKNRVSNVLDRPIRDFGKLEQRWPTICTFHSLCLRVLRHYADTVGLPSNFTIYDAADQTKLMKDALKALDVSSTNFPPSAVHATISNAKNELQTPDMFAAAAGDFYQRQVARIYSKYQALLHQNKALDFDDLLLRTAHAFREHPGMLAELQERFRYILIDEYQDTNHAQYIIAHALALKHRNLCVVGDPDQSIYAWRGANIKNILEFETDYPDAKVVKLEQNYRSTKTILEIASTLIAHNTQRKKKGLWTENDQGAKAKVVLAQDEHDEARVVMEELKRFNEEDDIPWSDMAIFYRMNALSRVMEDKLRRANVPYQIARGVEFYNRKEIKDVLAYLRVIANPSDEVSLTRIINTPPRGIGNTTVKQMQVYATASGLALWDAMEQVEKINGLSTRAVNSTKQFCELVRSWRSIAMGGISDDLLADQKGLVQTITEDVVRRSCMEDVLRKEDKVSDTGNSPLENVNELISSAAEYDRDNAEGSLDDYLANVSLVSDADHMKGAGGAVTLMTLHAAKGLEFPVVAMIGLEDGILPHSRARENPFDLEEERRLCFVGITRAQRHLILTKAAYRTVRGLRERTATSGFLNEMPHEMLEITDRTGLPSDERAEYRQRLEFEADRLANKFRKGQMVRHPMFGVGRIAEIMNMGQHTRAIVEFNASGKKTLILEHARLEAVG
jgi:DNA helicase II / ATP-dependent DNA helicase PcrA